MVLIFPAQRLDILFHASRWSRVCGTLSPEDEVFRPSSLHTVLAQRAPNRYDLRNERVSFDASMM
jgi:hypothetical protein